MHMSGTSSLVLGRAYYEKQSSQSKTNNGVGSAYGDGSEINMTPYKTLLYDSDYMDTPVKTGEKTFKVCENDKLSKTDL